MRFGMMLSLRLDVPFIPLLQRGEHLYWKSNDAVSELQWTYLGNGGPYRCRALAGRRMSESEKRSKGVGVTHKSDTTQGLVGIWKL